MKLCFFELSFKSLRRELASSNTLADRMLSSSLGSSSRGGRPEWALMWRRPQVINEYESGKAIPHPQVISKLERALGCRLPRAPKKKKVKNTD